MLKLQPFQIISSAGVMRPASVRSMKLEDPCPSAQPGDASELTATMPTPAWQDKTLADAVETALSIAVDLLGDQGLVFPLHTMTRT